MNKETPEIEKEVGRSMKKEEGGETMMPTFMLKELNKEELKEELRFQKILNKIMCKIEQNEIIKRRGLNYEEI